MKGFFLKFFKFLCQWHFFTPGRPEDWYLTWLTDNPLSSYRHAHVWGREEKVTYLPFIHHYKPNGWLSKSGLEFSSETLHKPHLWCPKLPEEYRHDLIIELLVFFQHLLWCWAGEPRIIHYYGHQTCVFFYFLASQWVWQRCFLRRNCRWSCSETPLVDTLANREARN